MWLLWVIYVFSFDSHVAYVFFFANRPFLSSCESSEGQCDLSHARYHHTTGKLTITWYATFSWWNLIKSYLSLQRRFDYTNNSCSKISFDHQSLLFSQRNVSHLTHLRWRGWICISKNSPEHDCRILWLCLKMQLQNQMETCKATQYKNDKVHKTTVLLMFITHALNYLNHLFDTLNVNGNVAII